MVSRSLLTVAVNDAMCKHFFDNRYGTGQSTLDGVILSATDHLIAGKTVVVAGYGYCGRARRLARPRTGRSRSSSPKSIRSAPSKPSCRMASCVMAMEEAFARGDIFITVTGNIHVIRGEHFKGRMKDAPWFCNSGHFDVELDLVALASPAKKTQKGSP